MVRHLVEGMPEASDVERIKNAGEAYILRLRQLLYAADPYVRREAKALVDYRAGAVEDVGPGRQVARGNGKPRMRAFFIAWLDGKKDDVPGVSYAQVARAVARAKARDPLRFEALEFRQQASSPDKPTAVAWCLGKKITAMTLHRWFYIAVGLVVEELIAELNGQRGA